MGTTKVKAIEGSGEHHLLLLSAPYLLYIIVFVVARQSGWDDLAGIINTLVQTGLDVICALLAFQISRLSRKNLQTFFIIVGSAFAINILMDISYGGLVNIAGAQPTGTSSALAYMIPYTLFLFGWNYGWAALLLSQLRERRGDAIIFLLAFLILLGLFAIFLLHYSRRFENNIKNFQDIFHAIFAVLEWIGLVLALTCLLTRTTISYILLVAGFALLVAVDFVLCLKEIEGNLGQNEYWEIAWTLAQFLMSLGLVIAYKSAKMENTDPGFSISTGHYSKRSAFAGILLLISLGAVLISTLAALVIHSQATLIFFSVILITMSTILIIRIAEFYDEALGYAVKRISLKDAHGFNEAPRGLVQILSITGINEILTAYKNHREPIKEPHLKILFLASNPLDSDRLRLDEEIRGIKQALVQAEFRDKFDVEQEWAVRVSDLQEYFLRHKPNIVHFSGHGSPSNEIILEDNDGNSRSVSIRALSQLFSALKDNIRCVVLNACFSFPQAEAIAKHIDCVVGMSKAIGDSAAVSFAVAFYRALGYGRNVKTAFELGCGQIDLEGMEEQDTPKLLTSKPEEKFVLNGT